MQLFSHPSWLTSRAGREAGAFALSGGSHHEAHDEAIETQRLSSKAGEIRGKCREMMFFSYESDGFVVFSGKMMVK